MGTFRFHTGRGRNAGRANHKSDGRSGGNASRGGEEAGERRTKTKRSEIERDGGTEPR